MSDNRGASDRPVAARRQLAVSAIGVQLDDLVAVSRAALAAVDRADVEHQQYMASTLADQSQAYRDYRHQRHIEYVFRRIRLIPTPSMPVDAVSRALEEYEARVPVHEIVDSVLHAYDADNCVLMSSIADRLANHEEFTEWADVLNQAITAHKLGLDAIVAYPLLAMIEGLLAKFFAQFGEAQKMMAHNSFASEFIDFPARPVVHLGFTAMYCFLWLLRASVYKYEKWRALDQVNVASTKIDLNRHRLVHGVSTHSTRQHTLRCVLILECLGILLPETREMLTEHRAGESVT